MTLSTNAQIVRLISERMARTSPGGIVTFDEIARASSTDIRRKSYLVHSAIRLLNRDTGAIFASVRGIGYRRLLQEQAHELGISTRGAIRRKSNRTATMISRAVSVANDMPNEAKRSAMSEMATLGLLRMMATDKHRVEVPETAVAPPAVTDVARSVLAGLKRGGP